MWRQVNGAETLVETESGPIARGVQSNVPYRIRFQVTQLSAQVTGLYAKVWPADQDEAAAWTISTQNGANALQGVPGGLAIGGYNYQGPTSILIDDIGVCPAP